MGHVCTRTGKKLVANEMQFAPLKTFLLAAMIPKQAYYDTISAKKVKFRDNANESLLSFCQAKNVSEYKPTG